MPLSTAATAIRPDPGEPGLFAVVAARASGDAGVPDAYLDDYPAVALAASRAGRRLERTERDGFSRLGEDAARAGIPLPALVDLYLSATWRLWDEMLSARGALRSAGSTPAGALFRVADDAVEALTRGYDVAQRRAIRAEESRRREFVDDLLTGNGTPEGLRRSAAGVGFNLAGEHVVAVARGAGPLDDAGPDHIRLEEHLLSGPARRDAFAATREGLLVCALPASIPDPGRAVLAVLEQHGPGLWRIGQGAVHSGPGGVSRSYEEARQALMVAERLGWSDVVVPIERVAPYRLLIQDDAALRATATSVLGRLHRARGGAGPLVETLDAYFSAGGSVATAARRLHLSPRAVTYRLDRVADLTGRSPGEHRGRFELELAVVAWRLLDRQLPVGR